MIHPLLILYDIIVYILSIGVYSLVINISKNLWYEIIAYGISLIVARIIGQTYKQIWRYGGVSAYLRLIVTDTLGFILYVIGTYLVLNGNVGFGKLIPLYTITLLGTLIIRLAYRYCYKYGNRNSKFGKILRFLLRAASFGRIKSEQADESRKIKVAIIGAGRVGVALAQELVLNESSAYIPRCFVDIDSRKKGREIYGIKVISGGKGVFEALSELEIQEVIFAISHLNPDKKKELYNTYSNAGYKVKMYDYPSLQSAQSSKKRTLREFDVEELLLRKSIEITEEKVVSYYSDKSVLVTGGGGSIGSEICRQLVKMSPKELIILDVYENNAYNLVQELRPKTDTKIYVEICTITDRQELKKVFSRYKPDIVIHAAAHKHVPLMEHNCAEAIKNNVFGTLNVVQICKEYGTKHFHMVSTDKAVNPTNVMGATKRMCEFIVQAYSTENEMRFSATRFGNVLGSAGSVVPIFKQQIASGGPVTITDKRIIRYLMTIPEASSLVLESGAMSKNGELFVLDMGKPVKIYDIAQNMIKLSGATDVEIIEIGLRPGEKLYEELLVKPDELEKTDNNLIFVERESPITKIELEEKLDILTNAVTNGSDTDIKIALSKAVPTYKPYI